MNSFRLFRPGLSAFVFLASSLPAAAASRTIEGVPRFGHVFLIVGENTTYDHLTPTNAPYLMGSIRPRSAWLTEYYAATHWSQANYVALVSGQFTRCEQQDYGATCHQDAVSLTHQLDVTNQSWTTWLEGGTARCDTGSGGTCTSDTPCPLTGFYTTGNRPRSAPSGAPPPIKARRRLYPAKSRAGLALSSQNIAVPGTRTHIAWAPESHDVSVAEGRNGWNPGRRRLPGRRGLVGRQGADGPPRGAPA